MMMSAAGGNGREGERGIGKYFKGDYNFFSLLLLYFILVYFIEEKAKIRKL